MNIQKGGNCSKVEAFCHSLYFFSKKKKMLEVQNSTIKFHKLARELNRQNETSILNHLLSIFNVDYPFVCQVFDYYSSYPKIANLRCGIWYHDHFDATCYFKSTDGHSHFINFSLQRLNLHVALLAAEKGAVVIVDSTRKGKRFPDSFNKTIPIWCSVLNKSLNRYALHHSLPIKLEDTDLHLSSMVSKMEQDEIEQKLDSFVNKLLNSGIDLSKLYESISKPLRCLWIGTQSKDYPTNLSELSFTPIICVSASAPDYPTKTHSWHYIQGAGDDQESWCMGLTPSLFYANHSTLLQNLHDEEECKMKVMEIVQTTQSKSTPFLLKHQIQHASSAAVASIRTRETIRVGESSIWIAMYSPQEELNINKLEDIPWLQKLFCQFDCIVICCCKEQQIIYSEDKKKKVMKTIVKDSAKYKKSLEQEMNSILKFVKPNLYLANSQVAILCPTGNNESIAVALGILTYFYNSSDHSLIKEDELSSHASQLEKNDTTKHLVYIQSFIESGIPSKSLLKQINRVFLS